MRLQERSRPPSLPIKIPPGGYSYIEQIKFCLQPKVFKELACCLRKGRVVLYIKELRRIKERNNFPSSSYNYACDVSGVCNGNTVPLHNLTNNHDKFYINLINAFFLMK